MLEANSVKDTVRFYCDVLGFTCNASLPDDDGGLGWANVTRDGLAFMFISRHTHDHDDEDHDHDHPSEPVLTGSIYVNVDDVDALAAELAGKVELATEPTTMAHGMREFALVDPNGYWLIFGTPTGE